MTEEKRRYVGIDLGKREYTMAIIGKNGKMSIHLGKTSAQGRKTLYNKLDKTDKVALEAGNLAFKMAQEIIQQVGSEVRVLNAAKLPFIWDAPTKTDKEDAMKLAHLIGERRDEKLPIVPLPSEKEMEMRKITSNKDRETRNRTRHINRLHSLFHNQGHTEITKKDIATSERRGEAVKVLTGIDREEAEWILKYLGLHEQRIKELENTIKGEAKTNEDIKRLLTISGIGPITAYAFLAHVGDGSRFSAGAQVSNYIGFVPRLDFSGTIQRHGHITKRGNGYLRGLLVQAAWSAVRSKKGGALRERFIYYTQGRAESKKKTVVAVARKLAELMYSVLRNKTEFEVRKWDGPKNKINLKAVLENCA
ncbi:MAG: IS110 family transposase [Treponema sp.]|nr:IS110 family transposase [Treponema sp.]